MSAGAGGSAPSFNLPVAVSPEWVVAVAVILWMLVLVFWMSD
jgi:hypothetical protein